VEQVIDGFLSRMIVKYEIFAVDGPQQRKKIDREGFC
jgi:hypothetical protein